MSQSAIVKFDTEKLDKLLSEKFWDSNLHAAIAIILKDIHNTKRESQYLLYGAADLNDSANKNINQSSIYATTFYLRGLPDSLTSTSLPVGMIYHSRLSDDIMELVQGARKLVPNFVFPYYQKEARAVRRRLQFASKSSDQDYSLFGEWCRGLGLKEMMNQSNPQTMLTTNQIMSIVTQAAFCFETLIHLRMYYGLTQYNQSLFLNDFRLRPCAQDVIIEYEVMDKKYYVPTFGYILTFTNMSSSQFYPLQKVTIDLSDVDGRAGAAASSPIVIDSDDDDSMDEEDSGSGLLNYQARMNSSLRGSAVDFAKFLSNMFTCLIDGQISLQTPGAPVQNPEFAAKIAHREEVHTTLASSIEHALRTNSSGQWQGYRNRDTSQTGKVQPTPEVIQRILQSIATRTTCFDIMEAHDVDIPFLPGTQTLPSNTMVLYFFDSIGRLQHSLCMSDSAWQFYLTDLGSKFYQCLPSTKTTEFFIEPHKVFFEKPLFLIRSAFKAYIRYQNAQHMQLGQRYIFIENDKSPIDRIASAMLVETPIDSKDYDITSRDHCQAQIPGFIYDVFTETELQRLLHPWQFNLLTGNQQMNLTQQICDYQKNILRFKGLQYFILQRMSTGDYDELVGKSAVKILSDIKAIPADIFYPTQYTSGQVIGCNEISKACNTTPEEYLKMIDYELLT